MFVLIGCYWVDMYCYLFNEFKCFYVSACDDSKDLVWVSALYVCCHLQSPLADLSGNLLWLHQLSQFDPFLHSKPVELVSWLADKIYLWIFCCHYLSTCFWSCWTWLLPGILPRKQVWCFPEKWKHFKLFGGGNIGFFFRYANLKAMQSLYL